MVDSISHGHPEAFTVAIPDADLDDLRARLAATRWPDDVGNDDGSYGVPLAWLRDLAGYWAGDFDWRAQEKLINEVPQFRVEIGGTPIHYVHVRGTGPDPTPIVLSHGWPWTFCDWRKVIGPLTDPGAHGGDPADAFDVVVPSLPGFGFSGPLRDTGFGARKIADYWHVLMHDVLGYERFAVGGGDWGSTISGEVAHGYPESVIGAWLTLPNVPGVELWQIWFGEHHSGGSELVASPELVIAAAAERTTHIRLGTGVVSLPYHHPFQTAARMVQLSHMTRGRVMFGAGPGQLPTDAHMFGLEATELRPRLEESLDVVLRLLAGELVTVKTDWLTLNDAVLQLAPYGELEVSVVGTVSPSGPKLAGRHGLGLLSLAATDPTGNDQLPVHWQIMTEQAAAHGTTVSRDRWRLMGPMHVAETERRAREQVEYGLRWQYEYLSHITPSAIGVPESTDALADVLNGTGRGVIGTPHMAAAQIQRLIDRSGGFGTYLFQGADFASWPDTLRSYELFAEEVIPRFTGQLDRVLASYHHVLDETDANRAATAAARTAAREQYQRERGQP